MSMNPSCDSCCKEDAEHVLCHGCMQDLAKSNTDTGKLKERKDIVEFLRDVAKRFSVQTGERSQGAANAAYLIAKAVEDGKHLEKDK